MEVISMNDPTKKQCLIKHKYQSHRKYLCCPLSTYTVRAVTKFALNQISTYQHTNHFHFYLSDITVTQLKVGQGHHICYDSAKLNGIIIMLSLENLTFKAEPI